jgi:hypothetical protein
MREAPQLQRVRKGCAIAFGPVGELAAYDSRGGDVRPFYLAVR